MSNAKWKEIAKLTWRNVCDAARLRPAQDARIGRGTHSPATSPGGSSDPAPAGTPGGGTGEVAHPSMYSKNKNFAPAGTSELAEKWASFYKTGKWDPIPRYREIFQSMRDQQLSRAVGAASAHKLED